MNKEQKFIETKEYKRFAEFCDACIKYKYIGICYGVPGVGKTLSSRYYTNWDNIEKQIAYKKADEIPLKTDGAILEANTIFYTAPAVRATKMTDNINTLGFRINMSKAMYKLHTTGEEEYYSDSYQDIDLIIVDEIDRLKLQSLEQLRDIYDQNNVAMILIGMPGIEKRLARYPQLYSTPLFLASLMPSCVRSKIIERSNSAKAPRTLNKSFVMGLSIVSAVKVPMLMICTVIPRLGIYEGE